MGPHFVNRGLWRRAFAKSRTHSSAGERSLHTGEVQGSIPCASTTTVDEIRYFCKCALSATLCDLTCAHSLKRAASALAKTEAVQLYVPIGDRHVSIKAERQESARAKSQKSRPQPWSRARPGQRSSSR